MTREADPQFILALAARAGCDPRTAKRFIVGDPPMRQSLLRSRLEKAARELAQSPHDAPALAREVSNGR
jgi:hypothetical protein